MNINIIYDFENEYMNFKFQVDKMAGILKNSSGQITFDKGVEFVKRMSFAALRVALLINSVVYAIFAVAYIPLMIMGTPAPFIVYGVSAALIYGAYKLVVKYDPTKPDLVDDLKDKVNMFAHKIREMVNILF